MEESPIQPRGARRAVIQSNSSLDYKHIPHPPATSAPRVNMPAATKDILKDKTAQKHVEALAARLRRR